jgi:hypothetical protein
MPTHNSGQASLDVKAFWSNSILPDYAGLFCTLAAKPILGG